MKVRRRKLELHRAGMRSGQPLRARPILPKFVTVEMLRTISSGIRGLRAAQTVVGGESYWLIPLLRS